MTRPVVPGNVVENPDQPSPISVLEPPFEEDDNIIQESSLYLKPDHLGISPPPLSLSIFLWLFVNSLNHCLILRFLCVNNRKTSQV